MRYIPVTITNGKIKCKVIAFLDEGATGTFMEEEYATKLGVDGPRSTLYLEWTGSTHRVQEESMNVSIKINGLHKTAKQYRLRTIQTVKSLSLPEQTLDYKNLTNKYPYLKGIPVDSYKHGKPRILIGLNNWKVATTVE
jgi:hypothetical protein